MPAASASSHPPQPHPLDDLRDSAARRPRGGRRQPCGAWGAAHGVVSVVAASSRPPRPHPRAASPAGTRALLLLEADLSVSSRLARDPSRGHHLCHQRKSGEPAPPRTDSSHTGPSHSCPPNSGQDRPDFSQERLHAAVLPLGHAAGRSPPPGHLHPRRLPGEQPKTRRLTRHNRKPS